jgi:RNA polymerase sigma-70 factor (ECF subfamily)
VVSFLRKRRPDERTDTDHHAGGRLEDAATALEAVADAGPGPEEETQNRALLALLRECVAELPEPLRALCELLHDRGMKQTEAAQVLGLTTPTLTRRKQEAYEQLRRCLRRKGVEEEVFS